MKRRREATELNLVCLFYFQGCKRPENENNFFAGRRGPWPADAVPRKGRTPVPSGVSRQIDRTRGERGLGRRSPGHQSYREDEQISSPARRLRTMSGSIGSRRSHLANWASMRPAAMLAQ